MPDSPEPLPHVSIPLKHEGDAYILDIEPLDSRRVRLFRVLKFESNQNCPPTLEDYLKLPESTRRVIYIQIQKRFPKKEVYV